MQITRREFTSGLLAASAAPAASPNRLNVVLITNDQWRADCLGVAGNSVIRTPRLDAFAREGVMLENHFVQCPQCVPSRSALHTGRYPHVNRTPSNLYRLPDTEQTLATILGSHGYITAAVGELPYAPTRFLGGFQSVVASDPEYHAFQEKHGWRGPNLTPARRQLLDEHARRSKTQFEASPVPWPEELDETPFFTQHANRFFQENRNRPFFLHVNFRRPHHPFDPVAPYDRMYAGATFPASHKRAGEFDTKPPGQRKSLELTAGFDLRKMTDADLNRIKSYYYGMISHNDACIGQMLDQLDQLELAGRTLFIVTSDHGEMLGDHGLLFKGGYFYDEVLRVPVLLRAPGRLPAGQRLAGLTQHVDMAPTILELLDIPVPQGVQGRSLAAACRGATLEERPVYAEFPTMKMIRNAEWKLVHYLRAPHGELYNLREDPHELHNLYDDPGYAKPRQEMQSALLDWLIGSQDPLLAPIRADASD